MELVLEIGDRCTQVAFRELFDEAASRPATATVAHLLVLAAIELVTTPAVLEQLKVRGAAPVETVFVGDHAFIVTPTGICTGHVGLCKELATKGKRVVWLVTHDYESKAARLLRSYRFSRRVGVRRLEDFLSLRTLFTSWDKRISEKDAACFIVMRCQELLTERDAGIAISVR